MTSQINVVLSAAKRILAFLKFSASDVQVVVKTRRGQMRSAGPNASEAIKRMLQKMQAQNLLDTNESALVVGTQNSSTRDTWIESILKSLPAGTRLLDAGAGEMQYKKFCSHLKYVSQDLAAYDGSGNSAGLQTGSWNTTGIDVISDICSMPVDDDSFDAVLCTEVLEHLTDPLKALQELTRVLRTGGKLILTAPFCSLTHFAPYHYSTGFNKYFYLHHLTGLGYRDINVTANGNYFEFMAQELRRIQPMAEKYAGSSLAADGEFAISTLLTLLQDYSARDTGSSEMLHFDCQVLATKN